MKSQKMLPWGTYLLNGALTIVFAFIITGILGGQFEWEWVTGDTLFSQIVTSFISALYIFGLFAGLILFASWVVPVGIASGILIRLGLWVRAGKRPPVWSLMLTALIMMSLFTGRYDLQVQPRDGVEVVWITEPRNPIMSSLKLRQAYFEMYSCRYELIRWEASTLIYAEQCHGIFERQFQYDVETEKTKRLLTRQKLWKKPVPSTSETLSPVQKDAWFEVDHNDFSDNARWASKTLPSGDGVWHAVVTRNLFGPEDVVVVRP